MNELGGPAINPLGLGFGSVARTAKRLSVLPCRDDKAPFHRVHFKQQGCHLETCSRRFAVGAEVIIFLITPSRGIHVYAPQITHQFAFNFLITSPIS